MFEFILEEYVEPPEIDYEKIRQAGERVSQAAADFAKRRLSQFSSGNFKIGSVAGGAGGVMKELLRYKIVNAILGSGETRARRIEKMRAFIAKQIEENPEMTAKSMIADILSKMVKKEWVDIFGAEAEEIVPPSDDQLKKKEILTEPPIDEPVKEIDTIQASDIQMSDGSDVPDGPYRMTGRDPNKTHVNIEHKRIRSISETLEILYEQNPNEVNPNAIPSAGQAQGTTDPNMMGGDPNAMAGQDPNAMAGMDPNAMGGGMGMDQGMGMGMPGQDTSQMSADELGRIFELKKIYRRLLSIEAYLSFSSDPELTEISSYVSKAIEFFELLSSNITQFKDKIDGIIIVFYEFLKTIYDALKDYYERRDSKTGKETSDIDNVYANKQ